MIIEAVVNQEIRDKINLMLAYQRDDPILVRIICPKIRNVPLTSDGKNLVFDKIKKLIDNRETLVSLIINPTWMINDEDKKFLDDLKNIGVKIHANNNLHAKLILVQNDNEKLALIGSANISRRGLFGHDEASVFFLNKDEQVYEKLFDYITRMLKRANEYTSGGDSTPRKDLLEKTLQKFERKVDKLKEKLKNMEFET